MPTKIGTRSGEIVAPAAITHIQALAAFGLLIVAFWPILTAMFGSWFDNLAYMEHGVLVAPVAGWMVWSKRAQLSEIPREPSTWGMVWMLVGAIQACFGMAAHWVWVSRVAVIVSLAGGVMAFYGSKTLRALSFPMATLFLMIAPPTFLYERLTLGLQLLASRLGEAVLEAMGYPVLREGNILELVGGKLSIAEACSGIRSLPAIIFVTTTYDFFVVEGKLLRIFLLIMSAPIAILGNGLRIVVTGIASQHGGQLTQGAAHETLGYLTVAMSGTGCVLLHLAVLSIQKARRSRRG